MINKTITYVDFDGVERTEDFRFNLTQAEVAKLAYSVEGGLDKTIEQIVKTEDMKRLIELFSKIIDMAYGVKSLDGKKFLKSPEILEDFKQSQAYSDLFMELATDTEAASAFINGVIPSMPEPKVIQAAK